MLAFAYYLLKVIICSAVLFGYYWFFLRNKVFHAYNRFYLLAIIVLSVGLPVIKLNIFHEATNKTTVIKMLQVVTASGDYMDEIIIGAPTKSNVSFVDFFPFMYLIISAAFLIMLVQMLVSIFALLKKNKNIYLENIHFINTNAGKGTPFSFFKYIFWNNQIDINSPSGLRIFKHEIAHVQQGHSWDKMFINIMLVIFWCNPIFWLIRKELSMIHEFIADKQAVEDGDTTAFAAMILQATYPQKNFYITNNFFYSPIKRRLMMLTKNQHPRLNYISRLLVLPLLVIVFGAFTIKIVNNNSKPTSTQKLDRKIVVVIDAGHGGTDFGSVNKNGITEKDVALQLVKKIKELNEDENIQIILSRENDVFSDPRQKATFAKAQNPDLFISVHLDNGPKKEWNTHTGMSVFVSKDGNANTENSKVLASSIISSFNKNYGISVPSKVSQRRQGIWVLQANSFPSVLIEAGFLTNDTDVAYLQSNKGQETFARNVLNAINTYAAADVKLISAKTTLETRNDLSENKEDLGPQKIPLFLSDSIRRNNETVNLLMKVTKDSADIVYLLNGKKIDSREAKVILSSGAKLNMQVHDAASAYKTFGLKTKNGLLNILDKSKNTSNAKLTTDKSVKVGVASDEDVKLFKKLGHVFIRVERDGPVPYKGPNRLVLRDGVVQNSLEAKFFKGDLVNILSGKDAVEKYGAKALDGALEITSKHKYEEPLDNKIPFINYQDTSRKKVFTQVEVEPEFLGGKDAWRNYLQKNIQTTVPVSEGWKPGTYTIILKFIVEINGNLSDITTENYTNSKTAKHCIEIIKNGPKWKPAMQNGHIVAAYRRQPITFVVI